MSLRNRTAERGGRQNACVWGTWQGYYLHVLTYSSLNISVFGLLKKICWKEDEAFRQIFFKQNYCHACLTRLPSSLLSRPVTLVHAWALLSIEKISYKLESAPCTYPVVMVTVGAPRTEQPSPSIWFFLKDIILPTLILSAPSSFFSLLALFFVKLSLASPDDLDKCPTTLTCVSLPWLRYHHRAQWLAWFCFWLHR